MPKKIFIGVAWPYVNGDLHIGHLAGYLLPADIFARSQRYLGNDVLMVSGSDCFGTPITIEADKRGVHPKNIVDEYHKKNKELFKFLGISFDIYTKTDTENHERVVQQFFLKFLEKGLIFKNTTKQYYSPEEKRFLPDRYVEGVCSRCGHKDARSDQCENCGAVLDQGELIEPRSKNSGSSVELHNTEHYFLDWPKLESFLKKYVKGKKGEWRDWVYRETDGWLKKGLKPRAITRDLDWGIKIPTEKISARLRIENTDHKRIYVWFEAVIGYLSASIEWSNQRKSEQWKEWWQNKKARHYYFMGKDNLVFHTIFWPGELHAYDRKLNPPNFPCINQFLNLEGQKISKSRGVIIDSRYITEKYGIDPVRFYLTTIMPENHDTNFTWNDFSRTTNDILIGVVANFIHRALTLAEKAKLDPKLVEPKTELTVKKMTDSAKKAIEACAFKKYTEIIQKIAEFGNKYISEKEPWTYAANDIRFNKILSNGVFIVLAIQSLLKPLLPDTYKKLSSMTGIDFHRLPDHETIKTSLHKLKLTKPSPLFSKIDPEVIAIEKSKIDSGSSPKTNH